MRRATRAVALVVLLLTACRGEEERRREDAEATWDSMVERSRERPARLDTMSDLTVPRSDSAVQP